MAAPLDGLAPRSLWEHFASIAAIPRPSKREERIAAWVRELGRERGFDVRGDAAGNVVLAVPASPGREAAPPLILQGHLDMVCEKNRGVEHDFDRDPIRPRLDGEWIRATGTTLGADNGIGVAAALAVATDPAVVHGPLELLFTIDEETGLTGAARLDPALLHGRTLLNLDSEENGILYVGCAGGADSILEVPVARGPVPPGSSAVRVELRGLPGGHSGSEIHQCRGNALKLIVRALRTALAGGIELDLVALSGGSMHNAIPREADAVVLLASGADAALRGVLERVADGARDELREHGAELTLRLVPLEAAQAPLPRADRDRLLDLLAALPHGVLAMSPEIPGLVETSSNLAVVRLEAGAEAARVVESSRSSVAPSLAATVDRVRAASRLAGATLETRDGYPGWKPNLDSPVLGVLREVYREVYEDEPRVTAIHAGLECGLLGERVSGLDMISFGPRIEGAHSPDERVHVPSVERFFEALTRAVDRLSRSAAPAPRAG